MQKEYYSITNKLYSLKDADHFDYAIMSAVATFNYPFVTDSEDEKVTEIKVQPFTITDIASRLKLSNTKNVKVNNEKIEQSLKKLMKAKVLKVVEVLRSEDKENTFILKQNVDTEGQFTGFASIIVDEFFNITLKIKKDSDRIKALACYVSIVQRIFKAAKRTKQANFNWENTLTYFVNWESQENIGNKYGMSRKAVAKSIELLCDVEAIALRVIKQKNGGKEVKNIYSKFSDSEHLDDYIKLQLENGEYAKEVVKKVKVAKVKEVAEETKAVKIEKVVKAKEVKAKAAKKEVAEIKQEEKEQTKAQIQSMKFNGVENGDDIAGYKKQAKIFDDTAFKSSIEKARVNATDEQQKLLDLAEFKASEETTSTTTIDYNELFIF